MIEILFEQHDVIVIILVDYLIYQLWLEFVAIIISFGI
jgi:hypothetical protein